MLGSTMSSKQSLLTPLPLFKPFCLRKTGIWEPHKLSGPIFPLCPPHPHFELFFHSLRSRQILLFQEVHQGDASIPLQISYIGIVRCEILEPTYLILLCNSLSTVFSVQAIEKGWKPSYVSPSLFSHRVPYNNQIHN